MILWKRGEKCKEGGKRGRDRERGEKGVEGREVTVMERWVLGKERPGNSECPI